MGRFCKISFNREIEFDFGFLFVLLINSVVPGNNTGLRLSITHDK
jgi:hypothetical protein